MYLICCVTCETSLHLYELEAKRTEKMGRVDKSFRVYGGRKDVTDEAGFEAEASSEGGGARPGCCRIGTLSRRRCVGDHRDRRCRLAEDVGPVSDSPDRS